MPAVVHKSSLHFLITVHVSSNLETHFPYKQSLKSFFLAYLFRQMMTFQAKRIAVTSEKIVVLM